LVLGEGERTTFKRVHGAGTGKQR